MGLKIDAGKLTSNPPFCSLNLSFYSKPSKGLCNLVQDSWFARQQVIIELVA